MMETRQNSVQFQRPTFLPMLCSRPSIKNVTLPAKSHQEDSYQQADPLSPKISCIGQVKRSNKIVGFPTTTSISITPASHHRYFKLKRLFSGKNLSFSAPTTTTTRTSRGRIRKEDFGNKKIAVIDVAELDPPLPVVKKTHDGGAGDKAAENLWKRRSGGSCQLRSLQIQPNGDHQLK
ncbi:unnamed protein product [Arabidopsis lyrata]|uniref:Predicted protein n=1 Tax=Arabidopsis lyrata subsp. lyrata TaxID=81972 RepID=D7KM28_ARALL|nr:uncharacterized protein LOC9329983 [Arabidopsis lyrata subsp. lyrata]EFH67481.1 predicted protein [Arabidopsis lyrata subsp. lyrata]CAH8254556.1 unnamed protein product [Arabidopsis lyrata]|eukprot:XP_002891222.1 uncharacterized protein LOC9329983 [Arabidopsis lyrata subsp. lyrata]